MSANASVRSPYVAALLGLVCHGLGHVYAGRVRAGIAIHAASIALATGLWLAIGGGLRTALAAAAVVVTFWVGQALHAGRSVAAGDRPWISRPLGLAAFYVATIVAATVARLPLEPHAPRSFSTSSGSMAPTLRPGDWFIAARRGRIERGDVVVHRAPSSAPSKDPLVKRVVAIGGDLVEIRDGRLVLNQVEAARERDDGVCTYERRSSDGTWHTDPCVHFVERIGERTYDTFCTPAVSCGDVAPHVVPARHVFVLGDHRDHSADSRVYGPVPEEDLLGRASWVYFSLGPAGVRWDRIGTLVR